MDTLRLKLKWLMGIRVAVVSLTLGVWIYLQLGKSPPSLPAYYSLIIATYLLTIAYSLLINRVTRLRLFAYLQIGTDIVFETILVALTGGVESPFSLLYVISITSASAILSRTGGLLAASASGMLYGAIVDLQYYRAAYQMLPSSAWLPATTLPSPTIFYNLSINVLGFIMVGYLTGTLAEKLKSAGERLEKKDRDLLGFREFHQCIVESIDTGVFTTDTAGRITSFNRRAEEIMGQAKSDVHGLFWWEVFLWPVAIGGKGLQLSNVPHRFEEVSARKDGRRLILGMGLSPLQEGGRHIGIVGVFQDITPLKKMEEVMRRKQWLATIGEMSAGMAHEVRNPLAALSGAMQVLRKDLGSEDTNRPLLDMALRETERLNAIVTDFLRYARPRPLNFKYCDVNALADETVQMLEQTPEYAGSIRFVRDLEQGISTVMDPDQMRQVFWNLGQNACQAMPKGGILTLSTRRVPQIVGEGESVEIVFSDTGDGVAEDILDKIFYPFFTTKPGGTGLGLAVVHRIMDEHRGTVSVDSVAGRGTSVCLALAVIEKIEQEVR
ncbi:MAG: PAS domain S-box protein [Nitrospirae bacterium]|nr:MAG: PAS domain S-box protein [Nitrospirota bacterium]